MMHVKLASYIATTEIISFDHAHAQVVSYIDIAIVEIIANSYCNSLLSLYVAVIIIII